MKKVLDKNIKYLKSCKIVLGFWNSRSCIREFNQTKSPNMHKSRKNRLRNIKCTESEN